MARILGDTRWLEMHGGKWRVSVAVPRALKGKLGTRLKRSLHTDSLSIANHLKLRIVDELQSRIARELETSGLLPRPTIAEALALREELREANGAPAFEDVHRDIARLATDILGPAIAERYDDETESFYSIYDPKRSALTDDFLAIARGTATPFFVHHDAYLEKSFVKARTKADDIRAVKYLTAWCQSHTVPPTIEAISRKLAVRFMDDLGDLTGQLEAATQNKYLNRLSRFWQFMAKREIVETNVWAGLRVAARPTPHNQTERAFTDDEVRKLLSGGASQKLMDVMMIGALSGARLDAIVDLKVQDTVDGAFTFKPQKKEATSRDVPIHPALQAIVERRSSGKRPGDDLFPDWPGPRKLGSHRERSFKASNAFTQFRRRCGVDDRVEGKRRALVNFHSFRRWFITKAERAGNSGDLIAAIVGHKRTGMTLGRYSEGPEMRMARRCVKSVQLPALDRSPAPEARAVIPRRTAKS